MIIKILICYTQNTEHMQLNFSFNKWAWELVQRELRGLAMLLKASGEVSMATLQAGTSPAYSLTRHYCYTVIPGEKIYVLT